MPCGQDNSIRWVQQQHRHKVTSTSASHVRMASLLFTYQLDWPGPISTPSATTDLMLSHNASLFHCRCYFIAVAQSVLSDAALSAAVQAHQAQHGCANCLTCAMGTIAAARQLYGAADIGTDHLASLLARADQSNNGNQWPVFDLNEQQDAEEFMTCLYAHLRTDVSILSWQ